MGPIFSRNKMIIFYNSIRTLKFTPFLWKILGIMATKYTEKVHEKPFFALKYVCFVKAP